MTSLFYINHPNTLKNSLFKNHHALRKAIPKLITLSDVWGTQIKESSILIIPLDSWAIH